jgi:predicted amidohydrolase
LPVKVAVIQHKLRSHERMDLAALLASSEDASDDGASVIVCPRLPGVGGDSRIYQAFIENMRNHAPGSLVVVPALSGGREEGPTPFLTPLGRTVALSGDECLDPAVMADVGGLGADAMVWQPHAESGLQAEAFLELALDASLSVAGLVLVTALVGRGHGTTGFGGSAIVQLGDILAEAGEDEEVVSALLEAPVPLPDRHGARPDLPPILAQRLAHHRGGRASVDWPADLS